MEVRASPSEVWFLEECEATFLPSGSWRQEVEDLASLHPRFASTGAGKIYLDVQELGWGSSAHEGNFENVGKSEP